MKSSISALTRKKIEPAPHQLKTMEQLLSYRRIYNLSEMGTGKTLPAVQSIKLLFDHTPTRRILAIAPLSVIRATWEDHMEQFAEDMPMMLLDVAAKRRRQIRDLPSFEGLVLINPDGLKSVVHELMAWRPQLVIIDELSGYYRKCTSDRWKAANVLLRTTDAACWAFTGSPLTNNLMDSYAQCLLVNPRGMPQKRQGGPVSFLQYRDMLCNQPYPNVYVPKKDALERVQQYMQPAIRFTRKEVMADLPAAIRIRKDVPLTPEQQKALDDMRNTGKAIYEGRTICGAEARAVVTKVIQIVTGSVYDSNHVAVDLPFGPRLQALVDLHEEVGYTPIIVSVPFIHTSHRLHAELTGKGYKVEIIIGDVKPSARLEVIERFQRGEIDFLICHPKTLAHGVTLTRSHTVCWFGPIYDLELYAQLNDRVSRFGQTDQPLTVELCSTPAEREVYSALRGKERLAFKFLDLF